MDDKGVSPLIGFILIMLIVVTFLGALQSTIPDECEKKEAEHISKLESQIMDLKDIPSTPTTYKFDMGVNYPQYLLLNSPNSMSTTVDLEKFNLTLEYEEVLTNGTKVDRERNITTTRVILSPRYMYYPQETLIMENTALFKKADEETFILLSNQTMFKKEANLIGLDYPYIDSSSFTRSDFLYLTVEPVYSGGDLLVENLTVTFESVNPEYWENINNYDVTVNGDTVTVNEGGSINLNYAYALFYENPTGTEINYSSYASQSWDPLTETELVKKVDYTIKLNHKESELLDILKTVDGYNNPIGGFKIEASTTWGSITPQSKYTDAQGEAIFAYEATKNKNGEITFTCPNCTGQKTITFEVEVKKKGKP